MSTTYGGYLVSVLGKIRTRDDSIPNKTDKLEGDFQMVSNSDIQSPDGNAVGNRPAVAKICGVNMSAGEAAEMLGKNWKRRLESLLGSAEPQSFPEEKPAEQS